MKPQVSQMQAQPADQWIVQPAEGTMPGRVRPLPGALLALRKGDSGLAVFLSPHEARRVALSLFNLAEAAEQRELEEAAKAEKVLVTQ
jgi:hypothetical protein